MTISYSQLKVPWNLQAPYPPAAKLAQPALAQALFIPPKRSACLSWIHAWNAFQISPCIHHMYSEKFWKGRWHQDLSNWITMNHIFPILFSYPMAHIYKQICSPNCVVILRSMAWTTWWPVDAHLWPVEVAKERFLLSWRTCFLDFGPVPMQHLVFFSQILTQHVKTSCIPPCAQTNRRNQLTIRDNFMATLAWTVSKKWSWHAHHRIFFAFLFWIFQRFLKKTLDPGIQRRCNVRNTQTSTSRWIHAVLVQQWNHSSM